MFFVFELYIMFLKAFSLGPLLLFLVDLSESTS